jgi:hypothetical protein
MTSAAFAFVSEVTQVIKDSSFFVLRQLKLFCALCHLVSFLSHNSPPIDERNYHLLRILKRSASLRVLQKPYLKRSVSENTRV